MEQQMLVDAQQVALALWLNGYYPNPEEPDGDWGPIGPVVRAMNPALAAVLRAYYPDPDGPDGGWGPAGPYVRSSSALVRAGLNPQPLPPVDGQWRAVLRARALINQGMFVQQLAGRMNGDQGTMLSDAYAGTLQAIIDDWCGTGRPKWPFPWPKPRWYDAALQPEELVAAGTQFKIAAGFDTALGENFAAAADQLLETGLGRLG